MGAKCLDKVCHLLMIVVQSQESVELPLLFEFFHGVVVYSFDFFVAWSFPLFLVFGIDPFLAQYFPRFADREATTNGFLSYLGSATTLQAEAADKKEHDDGNKYPKSNPFRWAGVIATEDKSRAL